MTLTRTLTALAACAAAGLLLTACGGSDSPEVANLGGSATTTEDGETTEAEEDPEEAMLAFTECMRDEGIDLPDPTFSEDGEGGSRFQVGPGEGIDPDDPDFQAAQEKCQPLLEGIQGRFDPEDREAFEDAALEYAQCMRDHGFDVPDPEFNDGPGGGGFGIFQEGNLDPNDPDVRAAMEDCQSAFDGLGPGPGGPDAPPDDEGSGS